MKELEVLKPVIMAAKDRDLPSLLKGLSPDDSCRLMRHLYTGMAQGDAALSTAAFRWHDALVSVAGLGCIMRVLTTH